jgi:uncharacterized protein (DUF58 family)
MPSTSSTPSRERESRLAALLEWRLPEVWLRFGLALLGLALAFAAALFSTVSRQSGNVIATALLATLALLLAGVVGLTTVPYLARRIAVEHVRDGFDYDVTAAGFGYLALALLLGLAALNTGNNLLWIVVSAMVAALLLSGGMAALDMARLELDIRLPEYAFAGRPLLARVALQNARKFLPSFSVSVAPAGKKKARKTWRLERGTFTFPSDLPRNQQWLRLPDFVVRRVSASREAPAIFSGSVYFPYVAAAQTLAAQVELHFARRGLYAQRSFAVSTRFPFGLLRKTRHTRLQKDLVVFPPVDATDDFLEVLPLISGEFESYVRGRGYDLYRIREYTQEDSARHLDWKATAKSGVPLVREFTREDERKLRIVFDNPPPGAVPAEQYERAIAMAASVTWHFASQQTQLSYAAPGYTGEDDVYRFLAWLALAQPDTAPSVLDRLPMGAEYNVIFTARARGSIPTPIWTRSYLLFIADPPAQRQAAEKYRS